MFAKAIQTASNRVGVRSFHSTSALRFKFDASIGLNEDQKMFQQAAREFSDREIAPFAAKWDEEKFFPVDTLKKVRLVISFLCGVE